MDFSEILHCYNAVHCWFKSYNLIVPFLNLLLNLYGGRATETYCYFIFITYFFWQKLSVQDGVPSKFGLNARAMQSHARTLSGRISFVFFAQKEMIDGNDRRMNVFATATANFCCLKTILKKNWIGLAGSCHYVNNLDRTSVVDFNCFDLLPIRDFCFSESSMKKN